LEYAPVHTTLIVFGSRGDVQPHMALAVALREAGHEVRYATHREFEGFVRDHGMEFAPLAGNPHDGERIVLDTPVRCPTPSPT
jgi:sterol 3beta-glucosyltransferase